MKLHLGDCLEILKKIPDESIDSLVTDPPAGISFMGKEWDSAKGGRKEWIEWMSDIMRECLRVLKPGAHGLVWSLPRTSHWTATALEEAGFEVRDQICHLFGVGFPKSLNISKAIDKAAGAERNIVATIKKTPSASSQNMNDGWKRPWAENHPKTINITAPSTDAAKQWDGWGTALKPAQEIWWLIRKPLSEKTVAENVLKWGVGGINVDGCRVGTEFPAARNALKKTICGGKFHAGADTVYKMWHYNPTQGRFPANLVLSHSETCTDEKCADECAVKMLNDQSGSGASRFFYCAKASKSDKNAGCDLSQSKVIGNRPNSGDMTGKFPDHDQRERVGNFHPTVKSTKLMSYLIKLVTPLEGTVLDPFMGSGSTGLAAIAEGFQFIGIEKESEYFEIAQARIKPQWFKD